MAKEEDLKRIELKVSVNCCEGCRKKVLKALSIQGVLRTEIDPDASKVAVVGSVDAKVLLKRLSKIGKTAELIVDEAAQKPEPEEEEKKTKAKPEEPKKKKINGGGGGNSGGGGGAEKRKPEGTANSDSDKIGGDSESKNSSNGGGGKEEENGYSKSFDYSAMASQARVYRPMEAIALPVAINAYHAPAAYCYGGHYCYEMPVYRAPASAAGYGNYCSDESSVGCRIM